MESLNPKVLPELTRYRYKYTNKRKGIYILASHIGNGGGTSHVEWSLYLDNRNEDDDNEPLVELIQTTKTFIISWMQRVGRGKI